MKHSGPAVTIFLILTGAWMLVGAPLLKDAAFQHTPAWAMALAKSDPVRWCGIYPITDGYRYCGFQIIENVLMYSMFLPLPLSLLIGGLLIVVGHFGAGLFILRTSSPLWSALKRGLDTLRSEPGLFAMPTLSMVATAALLGGVGFYAMSHHVPGGPDGMDVTEEALAIVLSPAALAGYFLTATLLLLSNAVLIHSFLRHGSDRPPTTLGSILAVLRIAPAIVTLSLLVFSALLGLSFAMRAVRRRLPGPAAYATDFAGYFIESGVLIATQLVIAGMLDDQIGLREAVRRTAAMVKPAGREILTAAFGIATMRHEACFALPFGTMGFMMLLGPWVLGGDLPVIGSDFGKMMAVGGFIGVFLTAGYFALVMAIEGVLAAGIYVYGRDGRVLPGMDAAHLEAFLNGLQDRLEKRGV